MQKEKKIVKKLSKFIQQCTRGPCLSLPLLHARGQAAAAVGASFSHKRRRNYVFRERRRGNLAAAVGRPSNKRCFSLSPPSLLFTIVIVPLWKPTFSQNFLGAPLFLLLRSLAAAAAVRMLSSTKRRRNSSFSRKLPLPPRPSVLRGRARNEKERSVRREIDIDKALLPSPLINRQIRA